MYLNVYSGQDGTIRVWGVPNRSHYFLQQTFVFNRGQQHEHTDMENSIFSCLCWNTNGKFLAGALENMINIWPLAGKANLLLKILCALNCVVTCR